MVPLVLALLLYLASPRGADAESSLQTKYEYYQEEDGRITVDARYLAAELDLGTSTHLSAEGVIDTITGATPTGEPASAGSDQVPLSYLEEKRTGVVTSLTQGLPGGRLRLEYARSDENDYLSNGYSTTFVREFNQKNTELQLGLAYTDDTIREPFWDADRKKLSRDLVIGVTQLLDARTTLTVNYVHGLSSGYMSDPYKLVQKTVELAPGLDLPLTYPENRPGRRTKDILFVNAIHYFENLRASTDASFRYYRDGFGVDAMTWEVAWYQKLGPQWILRPALRFHQQSAADFYHVNLDNTAIDPVDTPDATTPYYSSDYRLSKFDATTVGLKLIYNFNDRFSADLMFERYAMHGRDGITPASAYATANTWTVGLRVWF
jgi:Protein of unknown function (DUF3570)